MATANVDVCEICTHEFDTSYRQSVSLPCGHNFCSSCLIRMRVSGKQKCPNCRYDWSEMDATSFPGLEAIAPALLLDQDEEDNISKKKSMHDRCERHSMPIDFWAIELKEFFCRKCTKENRHADIELIEEAILQIRTALASDAPKAKNKLANDLEFLDEMHGTFISKRNCVKKFIQEIMTLDNQLKNTIEEIVDIKSQVLKNAADNEMMQSKIKNIQSPADLTMAMECKSTLMSIMTPLSFPATDFLQTLLCNIVCCYVDEAATKTTPSQTSFVNALVDAKSVFSSTAAGGSTTSPFKSLDNNETLPKFSFIVPEILSKDVNNTITLPSQASANNQYRSVTPSERPLSGAKSSSRGLHPSLRTTPNPSLDARRAALRLKTGLPWTVNSNNWEVVLMALALKQPSHLSLLEREDASVTLPLAALINASHSCSLTVCFLDSFYQVSNQEPDNMRLELITAKQSLHLLEFFGHLDHFAIAKLPHTLCAVGLAIGSAADAAAVSGLRPWDRLAFLFVSVSTRVSAEHLKPLPSVPCQYLFFPFLSDADVNCVRPAIEALAPNMRIFQLLFPKSQLTAAGTRYLAQRLRGVTVTYRVTIELESTTWRPGAEEKESIAAEIRSIVGCGLSWEMD